MWRDMDKLTKIEDIIITCFVRVQFLDIFFNKAFIICYVYITTDPYGEGVVANDRLKYFVALF